MEFLTAMMHPSTPSLSLSLPPSSSLGHAFPGCAARPWHSHRAPLDLQDRSRGTLLHGGAATEGATHGFQKRLAEGHAPPGWNVKGLKGGVGERLLRPNT